MRIEVNYGKEDGGKPTYVVYINEELVGAYRTWQQVHDKIRKFLKARFEDDVEMLENLKVEPESK